MKEICEHYKNELDRISHDMLGLRDESDQKANELKSTIDTLRDKNLGLERENKAMLTKKSDLKTKIEFLENQIEESKISMLEMQSKCESFLKSALAKAQAENELIIKEYQEKIGFLEQNYHSNLQKMEDENRKLLEVTRDHKEIEDELINLSKQASSSLKMNDPVLIAKKIQELLNVQDSLRKELEFTRNEKDNKIAELVSKHEREKEIYNIKIIECEVKMKNFAGIVYSSNKNNTNYNSNYNQNHQANSAAAGFDNRKKLFEANCFDVEKEKGKWKTEKEKLLATIENLNVQIQKIEKKTDGLHKENEQLRSSQNNLSANFNNNNNNNSNRNFISSNNNNTNNNNNYFTNNNDDKFSPNRISKTSRHNTSTLNDKEILIFDNVKKSSNPHINMNMQLMNSPLGDQRKSSNMQMNSKNQNNQNKNFNNVFSNEENNNTREHQVFRDVNSPIIMHNKVNRKESFIHKINSNIDANNNNNGSNFSPYKKK